MLLPCPGLGKGLLEVREPRKQLKEETEGRAELGAARPEKLEWKAAV